MASIHLIPKWFFGFNIAFELLFAISAALVAYYSFKIYRISDQRETKLFGLSFLFFALSYIVSSLVSLLFISAMEQNYFAVTIYRALEFRNIAVGLYIALYIIAIVTLLYTTLKINRLRIYVILLILTAVAINYSFNKAFMIFSVSSLFLLFINYHYLKEYLNNKNTNTLLVFIGMFFFFIGNAVFLVNSIYISTYVVSHATELIGYCFILASLARVIQNGKKKKQTGNHKRHTQGN